MRARSGWVVLLLLACVCGACGGGPDPAEDPAQAVPGPDARQPFEPVPDERAGYAPEPERTPLAQRCLDLVDGQSFAEAVEVCGLAHALAPTRELAQALEQARAIATPPAGP